MEINALLLHKIKNPIADILFLGTSGNICLFEFPIKLENVNISYKDLKILYKNLLKHKNITIELKNGFIDVQPNRELCIFNINMYKTNIKCSKEEIIKAFSDFFNLCICEKNLNNF